MKVLIVTGGSVDYKWAKDWIKDKKWDYIIAADSGLEHAKMLNLNIDFLLGDYDSVNKETLEETKKKVDFVTYPCEKDYTDTHIAILTAIKMKPDEIDIIGATGDRVDHTMTNVFVMNEALKAEVLCTIYDEKNKIYIKNKTFEIEKKTQYGQYLTVIPMTEDVVISMEGVKYPLDNYKLYQGLSVCQSNQITEEKARISVKSGKIIIFETKD